MPMGAGVFLFSLRTLDVRGDFVYPIPVGPGRAWLFDQELVERCLAKAPGAWEALVDRYAHLIYWAIERALGRSQFVYTQQDLEDLFQQVFLLLWEKKLKEAQGLQKLSSWLVIVTHRFVLDYVKAHRRLKRGGALEEMDPELLVSSIGDPGREAEIGELRSILEELMGALTAKERRLVRLSFLEEKTHSEIAELLKLPIGTISSFTKRLMDKWVEALQRKGIDP